MSAATTGPARVRPSGVFKLTNEYSAVLGGLYASTPKAVFAALVVSLLIHHETSGDFEHVPAAMVGEWLILHQNGIVPQAPPKRSPAEIAKARQ